MPSTLLSRLCGLSQLALVLWGENLRLGEGSKVVKVTAQRDRHGIWASNLPSHLSSQPCFCACFPSLLPFRWHPFFLWPCHGDEHKNPRLLQESCFSMLWGILVVKAVFPHRALSTSVTRHLMVRSKVGSRAQIFVFNKQSQNTRMALKVLTRCLSPSITSQCTTV